MRAGRGFRAPPFPLLGVCHGVRAVLGDPRGPDDCTSSLRYVGSVDRTGWYYPLVRLTGDRADVLEVGVIVEHREVERFGGGGQVSRTRTGRLGSVLDPGVGDCDPGVLEVVDVAGGEHSPVASARRGNLSVGHADRATGAFAANDDVRVVGGRGLIER